ncbi:MAG: NAD(P)H-quinone oxidoreductase [Pyrinomonadaceae bacterium]|nr:NAD(P)H-quinone oxidoreductase [Pyrinomonadaceae bacterium]
MKAVYIAEFGGPENLEIREVPEPNEPGPGEVTVRVRAAGLNRADLLQRRGLYLPPAGYAPEIPGLEFAGEIVETGGGIFKLAKGDRVFGITAGEAQAEYLTIDASLLARIPDNLSFTEAAAVPEVYVTAYDAIVTQAELKSGETLLVHAVGSGVGLAALQIGKAMGATVIGTSRSVEKLERCAEFGLDHAIDASAGAFSDAVMKATNGNGANVVLDLVGASYFQENLKSLALKGRLMLVGLTGGKSAEFDLGLALAKRLRITGTVLRARSIEEKAAAMRAFDIEVVPLLETGQLVPNVDRVFNFAEIAEAHAYLESNDSFGKVVLEW